MSLITYIKDFLGIGTPATKEIPTEEFFNIVTEIHIRELAFYSCVNMIANSISKCEFKTFVKNSEVKLHEYYLWNIEPNVNQNSSEFAHKLINQLYRNNECLVVESGGQLLVADSFSVEEFALKENVFSGVSVGLFTFQRTFTMSEVMYFKLSEQDMRRVINGIYEGYGKLIAYGMKSYQKSRGNRGVLNYETIAPGNETAKTAFNDLMNNRFKTFFTAENAVLPLPKGYAYADIGSKTYSDSSTRDIRAMADDISDFTAKGFGIPPALAKGDIAGIKDANDTYLTYCVDPLVHMIQEEINRKRNGYTSYSQGTYLKIDTKNIVHIDLLSVSTAIDKLIGSGAFSINDIRKLLGENEIDAPWANQHFITKNYSSVEDVLAALGGGGTG